jgi:energy-coupling factor transport system permease protein
VNNITFGKYINNHSFFTKLDARIKIMMMVVLLVFCFVDFNIFGFGLLFGLLCLLMFIAKLSFKSLFRIVKHMWFLFLMLLIINLLTIKGEVLFTLFNISIYKDAVVQTIYVFFRIVMLLMISTLLSSSTTPSELTYALEFYLNPLKVFKVNVYEIAIMVSIALRFIPTLIDEMERIKKAQTSRGIDFENGSYKDKLRGLTSLIIPLFISCFDKADELTNAMVARGYDSGTERSKYKHLSTSKKDIIACVFMTSALLLIILLNGVVL